MAVKSLAQSSLVEPFSTNSMLAGYESNYFHHLETVRLGGSAASVTFSNLARYSDYQHLQVRMVARVSSGGSNSRVRFQINGTGTLAWHGLQGTGSTVTSEAITSSSYGYAGRVPGTGATTSAFAATVMDILDPFDTSKNTTTRSLTGSAAIEVALWSNVWLSTDAISSIVFTDNEGGSFIAGSRFSLYGLKARA